MNTQGRWAVPPPFWGRAVTLCSASVGTGVCHMGTAPAGGCPPSQGWGGVLTEAVLLALGGLR